jgi:hypothetical protein
MANLSQIADAHKIIDNIIYITLATSDLDNVPWCPVQDESEYFQLELSIGLLN